MSNRPRIKKSDRHNDANAADDALKMFNRLCEENHTTGKIVVMGLTNKEIIVATCNDTNTLQEKIDEGLKVVAIGHLNRVFECVEEGKVRDEDWIKLEQHFPGTIQKSYTIQ
jgi:hypothetical protein